MPIIPETGEAEAEEPAPGVSAIGDNFDGFGGDDLFTDGFLEGPNLGKEFYNPKNSDVNLSFSGINGQILNVEDLKHRHIQPRSFCDSTMVGLTGNMPYRCDHFFQNDDDRNESYIEIPGANAEFYLPKRSVVVMTWMIGGASSVYMGDGSNRAAMALRVDGSTGSTGYRNITESVHIHDDDSVTKEEIQRPHRDRVWSGHYVKEMNSGWHSAGIVAVQKKRHLVFRTRNFKVIWFPKAGG
ncbi:MAG: hypothetical protein Unbinned80contig1000_7 [Prokaryotic dsDNA virus sp.]|nr:MAG: hypothetical protein Unbinned80contig1000_7 [Prokaryotic dsDNA virus sp.]|tara:strand:- start:565 stop:1287 length:723 start_codon:yes stop_codon:yes gene_type:complete